MISVIVPAWNAENTLERAVLSILQNRDKDTEIEVIIVDDGSTDSRNTSALWIVMTG